MSYISLRENPKIKCFRSSGSGLGPKLTRLRHLKTRARALVLSAEVPIALTVGSGLSYSVVPIAFMDTGMTAFRSNSFSIHARAVFKIPLLSWTAEVPSRFFRAIYGALGEMLYIQPSDLVASAGGSLADCSAGLRIFGGNSTLTLKANGVFVEFPSVMPDRIEFVNSVISQSYQALRTEFSELEVRSIEANAGHHIEIAGGGKAQDILAAGSQMELQKRAQKLRDAVVEPGMRFRLVDKNGKWNSRVTVEKSELVESGVFILREIIISDLSDCETTQQQFDLIDRIDLMALELVGLKPEVQVNDAN